MTTNDFSKISTMAQLREARKMLSDEISSCETRFSSRMSDIASMFSLRYFLLPAIRKLRKIISGTPFANT